MMDSGVMSVSVGFFLLTVCQMGFSSATVPTSPTSTVPVTNSTRRSQTIAPTGGNPTNSPTGGNTSSIVAGGNPTNSPNEGNPTNTVSRENHTSTSTFVSSTGSIASTSSFVTAGMSTNSKTVIESSTTLQTPVKKPHPSVSDNKPSSKVSAEEAEKLKAEKLTRQNINNGIAATVVIIGSVLLISIASCTSKLDKPTRKIKHERMGQFEERGQGPRLAACDSIENIRTNL